MPPIFVHFRVAFIAEVGIMYEQVRALGQLQNPFCQLPVMVGCISTIGEHTPFIFNTETEASPGMFHCRRFHNCVLTNLKRLARVLFDDAHRQKDRPNIQRL